MGDTTVEIPKCNPQDTTLPCHCHFRPYSVRQMPSLDNVHHLTTRRLQRRPLSDTSTGQTWGCQPSVRHIVTIQKIPIRPALGKWASKTHSCTWPTVLMMICRSREARQ